ncbi:MAG: hypothetical protein KGM47_13205 [Acidobacteriota bacterium]|nr:hypothetical protein [Acidobacteriota bacterium]
MATPGINWRNDQAWPELPLERWKDTYSTLHMWTQIVGKIRMLLSPKINHWWHSTLYVTSRGLTTSAIPYGSRYFDIEFDFIAHHLIVRTSDGVIRQLALAPRSVADFYQELMTTLKSLGIEVQIQAKPDEVPDPIPFGQDQTHASYDPEYAHRFWRILVSTSIVFKEFRSRFIGKSSPVHFFWGSFDLAVSRFCGRLAPKRPGADAITREAYSHEVISAGFWPGGGEVKGPAFYSYTVPEPAGYSAHPVKPEAAFYHPQLKEFILMYDDARRAKSPKDDLLDFLQSTYAVGATLAHWDRSALEAP